MKIIASRLSDTGYIFPPVRKSKGPYKGLAKRWTKLKSKEPSIAKLTPHGLRHAFCSIADDLGYTEATVGAIVGHKRRGVTQRYITKLDAALIAAAEKVSQRIADMMAGVEIPTAEVVEFSQAAQR